MYVFLYTDNPYPTASYGIYKQIISIYIRTLRHIYISILIGFSIRQFRKCSLESTEWININLYYGIVIHFLMAVETEGSFENN